MKDYLIKVWCKNTNVWNFTCRSHSKIPGEMCIKHLYLDYIELSRYCKSHNLVLNKSCLVCLKSRFTIACSSISPNRHGQLRHDMSSYDQRGIVWNKYKGLVAVLWKFGDKCQCGLTLKSLESSRVRQRKKQWKCLEIDSMFIVIVYNW